MLPKLSPDDLKGFATAIGRSAQLLSLASLTPVVLRGRMTFASARARILTSGAIAIPCYSEITRKPDGTTDASSTKESSIPCGFLSLLLLFGSEVVAGFRPLLWPAKDSGLVQAVEATKKVMKKLQSQNSELLGMGILDRMASVLSEVLKTKQVFATVHSALMICVLFGALLTGVVTMGTATLRKGSGKASDLARILGCLAPAGLLVAGHFNCVSKVLRSPSVDLCEALQMLLRMAGLVLANDDTPAAFAVFQAASLLTKISGDVASGSLAKDIGLVREDWHKLVDSHVAAILLPILLGLLWLGLQHLRSSTLLSATAVLSTLTSPVALALAWPQVTKLLGSSQSPEGLTKLISILYGVTAAGTLISGGSIGMLSVMVVVQILTRIHGTEVFSALS